MVNIVKYNCSQEINLITIMNLKNFLQEIFKVPNLTIKLLLIFLMDLEFWERHFIKLNCHYQGIDIKLDVGLKLVMKMLQKDKDIY